MVIEKKELLKDIKRPFTVNFDISVWKIIKEIKKETKQDVKAIIQDAILCYAKSRGEEL